VRAILDGERTFRSEDRSPAHRPQRVKVETLGCPGQHEDFLRGDSLHAQKPADSGQSLNLENLMETYTSAVPLSNIFGAAQIGDPDPQVLEFTSARGIVPRGAIVVLNAGKAELVAAGGEANVFGISLENVDTDTPPNTGAVAGHGSYKASQLIVPAGVNATAIETNLRDKCGILLEGDLVVPPAAAIMEAEAPPPQEPAAA
jgi:hypothetical protein